MFHPPLPLLPHRPPFGLLKGITPQFAALGAMGLGVASIVSAAAKADPMGPAKEAVGAAKNMAVYSGMNHMMGAGHAGHKAPGVNPNMIPHPPGMM